MIWKIVLILVLASGEPIEFVGSDEYPSRAACNAAAVKVAMDRSSEGAVITCISLVQAQPINNTRGG